MQDRRRDVLLETAMALSSSCVGLTRDQIELAPEGKISRPAKTASSTRNKNDDADGPDFKLASMKHDQFMKKRILSLRCDRKVDSVGRVFTANMIANAWNRLSEQVFRALSKMEVGTFTTEGVWLGVDMLYMNVMRHELVRIGVNKKVRTVRATEVRCIQKLKTLLHKHHLKARIVVDEENHPDDLKSHKDCCLVCNENFPVTFKHSRATKKLKVKFDTVVAFGDGSMVA